MDRTLCDYDAGFLRWRDNIKFPQSKKGFFRDLDPLPGAIESYKYLHENYDTWILTRPSFHNLECYTDKAGWVLDNFGFEIQQKLILCGNKSLVKGDFLIDDHHKDGQPEFEGKWIQIGKDPFMIWPDIVPFIDEWAEKNPARY